MINKWIGMGRLTADPELRQTQSGVSTCSFTVAIQRDFADGSGERQSDFISVVAWRQTAEFICRYFSKGKMIVLEGALRTRNYNDKRYPEVKHYVTEVLVDHAYFGGDGGKNASSSPSSSPSPQQISGNSLPADLSDFEEVGSGDDLPF